jgi:hypothetical protein
MGEESDRPYIAGTTILGKNPAGRIESICSITPLSPDTCILRRTGSAPYWQPVLNLNRSHAGADLLCVEDVTAADRCGCDNGIAESPGEGAHRPPTRAVTCGNRR